MAVPAVRVYGPELFPTHLRSRANGITTLLGVLGSAAGTFLTGYLADDARLGTLAWPIAIVLAGPLIVAALVLTVYPETGGRTLEELNPGDIAPEEPPTEPPSANQTSLLR
jgi:MFS family permease